MDKMNDLVKQLLELNKESLLTEDLYLNFLQKNEVSDTVDTHFNLLIIIKKLSNNSETNISYYNLLKLIALRIISLDPNYKHFLSFFFK